MSNQPLPANETLSVPQFLMGGGEMGQRIREYDWASTPLGHPAGWPQSLKTCVRIMLTSPQPMFVWWGKETLINIYNDPYRFVLGGKHPQVLGKSGKEVWAEIWDDLWTRGKTVFEKNEGTFDDALLLVMNRYGYNEETYFKFSYNPVPGDDGGTEGLFCACTEETERIVSERQLQTLTQLGKALIDSTTHEDVIADTIRTLEGNPQDFPFALFYSVQETAVVLAASTPLYEAESRVPKIIDLTVPNEIAALFRQATETQEAQVLEGVGQKLGAMPKGAWDLAPDQVMLIPIVPPAARKPYGYLVVGVNPYRRLNEKYKDFLSLTADQMATSFTQVHLLEEERKRAEALAEIDKAKTAFFTNISHEFRTPLTLILGSLEEELAKEEASQNIATSHRNAVRLLKLVNNLLDFSRIEAGRVKARFQLTDIAAFTANIAGSFRSAIENAGLRFTVHTDDIRQPVALDKEMWEKVVLNLLSNAFKYTLKGSIALSLSQKGNLVMLRVADTGVGIPEKELPKMFQRFHRIENLLGRTFEGTGIGLSLVKELVQLHGGEISVESKQGEGSTFTVVISAGRPEAALLEEATAESGFDAKLSEAFIEEAATLAEPGFSGHGTRAGDDAPLVLVVDDNADMRNYLKSLLQKSVRVATAANGQEALAAVSTTKPDLVLSDIMMPVMDGIQLLKALKEAPQTRKLPVILLSARAGEEAKIEGFDIGADDYLTKPFSAKELLARVRSQIELVKKRAKTEKELQQLFIQAPTAIQLLRGPDFVLEICNRLACEILGLPEEAVLGRRYADVYPEAEALGLLDVLKKVYATGQPYVADEMPVYFLREGKKTAWWAKFVFAPIKDVDGKTTAIMITGDNITPQVMARKKIEESEAWMQRIFQQSSVNFAVYEGPDFTVKVINEQALQAWGKKQEDVMGRPVFEISPELKEAQEPMWRRVYTTGEPVIANEFFVETLRNGKPYPQWFDFELKPLRNAEDDIVGLLNVSVDVSEKVLARKKLEQSENLFRTIIESSPNPIFIVKGEELLLTVANGAALALWQTTAGEVIGKPLLETITLQQDQRLNERLLQVYHDGKVLEVVEAPAILPRKNERPEIIYLNFTCQPFKESDGTTSGVLVTATNVTQQVESRKRIEESEAQLRRTKQQLELSINTGQIGIWYWDVPNDQLVWSKEQYQLYGIPENEFAGNHAAFQRFLLPEDLERLNADPRFFSKQSGDLEYEFRIRRGDGELRWISARSRIFYNHQGVLEYMTGTNVDITEQKQTEEKIRRAHGQLQHTLANLPAAVYLLDGKGNLLYVNEKGAKAYGNYSPSELLAQNDLTGLERKSEEIFSRYNEEGEPLQTTETPASRAFATGRPASGMIKLVHRQTGNVHWHYIHAVPSVGANGSLEQLLISSVEITAQKQAEEELRHSKQQLELLSNTIPALVFYLDGETKYTSVNQSFTHWFGVPAHAVLGQTAKDFVGEEAWAVIAPNLARAYKGETVDYETEAAYRLGGKRWIHAIYTPHKDETGTVLGVIAMVTDVTKTKQAEMALRESERRFRLMADAIPEVIWVTDAEGKTEFFNKRWEEFSGVPFEPSTASEVAASAVHPDDAPAVMAAFGKAMQTGQGFEIEQRNRSASGHYSWFLNRALPYRNPQTGAVEKWFGIGVDINERKKMQEALAESERELHFAIEAAELGVWDYNPATGTFKGNDRLKQWFGLPVREEISLSLALALIADKDRQRVVDAIQTALQYASGGDYDVVYTILHPQTAEERIVRAIGKATFNEQQLAVRFNGTLQDVTVEERARQRIAESENELQELVRQAPVAIVLNEGKDLVTKVANEEALRLMGKTVEQVINKHMTAYFPELPHRKNLYLEVLQTGKPYFGKEVEITFNRFGKSYTGYYDLSYTPWFDSAGKIKGVMSVGVDVTEKIAAKKKLEHSESLFRNIMEQAPDPILILKGENMVLEVANNPLFRIWNVDKNALGKDFLKILPEMKGQGLFEMLQDVYFNDKIIKGAETPAVFTRDDGTQETVYFNFTYQPYREADGRISGVMVLANDVTQQVLAKGQLRESEERFRSIANDTPAFIFMGDEAANVEFVNRQWLEFVGLNDHTGIGQAWARVTHPDDVAPMNATYAHAVATQQPYQFEIRQKNNRGEYAWVLWRGIPRQTAEGRFGGMIGVGIDITDRKIAEEALQQLQAETESQKRLYETVTNNTPDLIYIFDVRYRFTYANQALLRMWGKSWEDAIGKGLRENGYEEWHALMHEREIDEVVATKRTIRGTVSFPHAELGLRVYDYIFAPVLNAGGEVEAIAGTTRDISDIKKAEDAIKESEERFRSLANAMPQVVWIAEANGEVSYYNDRVSEFEGATKLADGHWSWGGMVHPNDLAPTLNAWQQAVAKGVLYEKEHRIKMRSGGYRWHLSRGVPHTDKDGRLVKWFGTATDIHAQKTFSEQLEALVNERTEALAQANTELQRSNEDLQQFAHVASHDLKEPVRKVMTFVSRLRHENDAEFSERVKTYLQKIESATNRMYSMIDGVLHYSTLNATQQTVEPVNLNDTLRSIETDLEVLITQKEARIEWDDLPTVEGTPILLYQLFYNLLNNSLKFSKVGVPPLITLRWRQRKGHALEGLSLQEEKRYAVITLQDNGIGFNSAEGEKIFQTFSRLNPKDKYEGTGLGLALCRKIVERHGGSIKADGRMGEGATFTIILPLPQETGG